VGTFLAGGSLENPAETKEGRQNNPRGAPREAKQEKNLLSKPPPPPAVGASEDTTFKLERNSANTEVGRPLVKMSANCDVVGT